MKNHEKPQKNIEKIVCAKCSKITSAMELVTDRHTDRLDHTLYIVRCNMLLMVVYTRFCDGLSAL